MEVFGWILMLALVAPLLSRRLGWDWARGGVQLLWGVICLAAVQVMLVGGTLYADEDTRGLLVLAGVVGVVGTILVFLGITGFRPLEEA